MTDVELAEQFAESRIIPAQTNIHGSMAVRYARDAALDMAEYKDKFTKSFLKEKYNLWKGFLLNGNDSIKIKISGLEEIYEDLFGEPINEL